MEENRRSEGLLTRTALQFRGAGAHEQDAMRSLVLLDMPAARSSIELVLKDVLEGTEGPILASYLLFDLLCRVERVVADHQDLPPREFVDRLSTVSRFAGARSKDELLWAFWSAYESATSFLSGIAPPRHRAIETVKEYVRENYMRKISLTEIAGAVGVSRNYLSHLFKRHCAVTVTEFIHKTRLREAERLLIHGGKTVSEIAYLVGYQNYRDFHRNFVRYEKTSPKRFRNVRAAAKKPLAAIPL